MKKLFATVLAIGLMANTKAQKTNSNASTMVIGTTAGYTMFYGNVQREGILPDQSTCEKDYGTVSGLFLQTTCKQRICYRFELTKGTLNGVRNMTKADYEVWFQNNYWQLSTSAIFPITNNSNRFSIKGICGVGLISYRSAQHYFECPKNKNTEGYDTDLNPISPRKDASLNLGVELVYKVNKIIGIRMEHSYHLATSSNLDAVKGKYNDGYSVTGIGLLLSID